MKRIILIVVFVFSVTSIFAQQSKDLKLNKETNLIEAIYYHDNGVVSQTGTYTIDGKLEGKWEQFNTTGKRVVIGNYNNGKKVGKWFYWTIDGTLKEVDYDNNKIASISEWKNKAAIAQN